MNSKKPFCYAPWLSVLYSTLYYDNKSGCSPCCEWSGDIYESGISTYKESDYLNSVKLTMLEYNMDVINHTCKLCIETESLGIESRRLWYSKMVDDHNCNINSFKHLDYRPSNLCNLKCRMCSHVNSSQIAKETNTAITLFDTSDIYNTDLSTLETLHIVGGEPSIDIEIYRFLNFVISSGASRNILLKISTNATSVNTQWVNILKKFKSVKIIVSLDGTGPTYEYIRTNANWLAVERNCDVYDTIPNVSVHYHIVVSILNIVTVEDWLPWFVDLHSDATAWPVDGQPHLTLNALPDDIRQEKIKYLSTVSHPLATTITNMLNETHYDEDTYQLFLKINGQLDTIRKTDCAAVSPNHYRLIHR